MSRVQLGFGCDYDPAQIAFQYSTSGGPGGQHANRNQTRVTAVLDLVSLDVSESQRKRLVDAFGAELRVVADDTRSQLRNREIAVERLEDKLKDALRPVTPRRKTKPSRAAKRRRLDAKARRSEVKKNRQKPQY